MTTTAPLHPDFAELTVQPGESHIGTQPELFRMVNVIAFGGAADRMTHVPEDLGRVGTAALWESTGAADQLPFWNTNRDGDAYLYLVHGSVRVEFKETGGERRFGHYIARTGDLFCLPKDIAHRTFSGDGKRRITIEIMPKNPHWDLIGTREVAPDPSGQVGEFTFRVEAEHVVVSAPGGQARCPRDLFTRALHAFSYYELHLGHNELDGGFVVDDHGDDVVLGVPGYEQRLPGVAVLAVLRGLLPRLAS